MCLVDAGTSQEAPRPARTMRRLVAIPPSASLPAALVRMLWLTSMAVGQTLEQVQNVDTVDALEGALANPAITSIVLLARGSPYLLTGSHNTIGQGPSALELTRSVTIRAEAGGRATLDGR